MGDSINVDYGLAADGASALGSINDEAQRSALAGYQIGGQQAQRNALNGFNINDPTSVDNTTQGLVRAGAADMGSAVQNLAWTRNLRKAAPGEMAAITDAINGPQDAPPAAPAAAAPAAPAGPTPGNFQFDPQNTYDIMRLAQDATAKLSNVPEGPARQQAAAAIKAQMLQKGVPEPAIDSAMEDLSDKGLDSLNAHYTAIVNHLATAPGVKAAVRGPAPATQGGPGEVVVQPGKAPLPTHVNPYPSAPSPASPPANAGPGGAGAAPGGGAPPGAGGPGGGGAPPSGPTPYSAAKASLTPGGSASSDGAVNFTHPSNAWASRVLHPNTLAAVAGLKAVGIDMSPLVDTARAEMAPGWAKQADVDAAPTLGSIAADTARKEQVATQPGKMMTIMVNGVIHQVPEDLGFDALHSPGAAALGVGVDMTPEERSFQAARGGAEGTAPYDIRTVKGPNGEDVTATAQGLHDRAAAHGGYISTGPTLGGAASAVDSGHQAAEMLKPDLDVRNAAVDSQATASRALSFLNSVKTNDLTPYKLQMANALRTLGVPGAEKFAGDVGSFDQLTHQELVSGAKAAFGGRVTNGDLKLYEQIKPTITSPTDAGKIYFGMKAAQAERTAATEDFKGTYTGDRSNPGAVQQAYASTVGARSLFQSPVWQGQTIAGKPAVTYGTEPGTGRKVGAFGVGTGHPVYFYVR